METEIITPHSKEKRKGESKKLREPTIPEIRATLKAIRKVVEKDDKQTAWILRLVEMAFKKVKE